MKPKQTDRTNAQLARRLAAYFAALVAILAGTTYFGSSDLAIGAAAWGLAIVCATLGIGFIAVAREQLKLKPTAASKQIKHRRDNIRLAIAGAILLAIAAALAAWRLLK